MKKAERIYNGHLNLNPIKTGIDWEKIREDFFSWRASFRFVPNKEAVADWFKQRIEKELNGTL